MSDDLPWMKIWVNDIIAKTVMWPGVAAGMYLQCLILEWVSGPLPDDAELLSKILKYNSANFVAHWPTVRREFESTTDGSLVNRTLEDERAEAHELRTKLSEAGKHGASKRREKKQLNGQANSHANSPPNSQDYTHQHHPQHSVSKTHVREEGDARGNAPPPVHVAAADADPPKPTAPMQPAAAVASKALNRVIEYSKKAVSQWTPKDTEDHERETAAKKNAH